MRLGFPPINAYTRGVPESSQDLPISPPRAWAEVSYGNLVHNYAVARKHGEIMAVLKAGAYGHGLEAIAACFENMPPDQAPTFLGVASVIEARGLADAGIQTRIYLLGPTCPFEREEIVSRRWTPCVSSVEEARDFDRLVQSRDHEPLPVHIAVDTGMGRGGFLPDELVEEITTLETLKHLEIEGLGSHLPSADEDEAFTKAQFDVYDSLVEQLGSDRFKYRHLSNSAGLLGYQSRCTNLYRPGLMLYGISPLPDHQSALKPALSLKSRVSLVRKLPAGHGISYGRQTVLEKDTLVATVGIGYGDGYPRELSMTGASVFIHGTRCPLLGRVTMDQIMVDVSALPICVSGDEVELFGENILVSEVARLAGAISWSVLTGITPRVTRVYQ